VLYGLVRLAWNRWNRGVAACFALLKYPFAELAPYCIAHADTLPNRIVLHVLRSKALLPETHAVQ